MIIISINNNNHKILYTLPPTYYITERSKLECLTVKTVGLNSLTLG